MTEHNKTEKIFVYLRINGNFVARDAFDTLYLCLLYDDEPVCRCTAIRISAQRLEDFLAGSVDLRSLFIHPETEQEYFDVVFQTEKYQKVLSAEKTLPEDKLPADGYILSGDVARM